MHTVTHNNKNNKKMNGGMRGGKIAEGECVTTGEVVVVLSDRHEPLEFASNRAWAASCVRGVPGTLDRGTVDRVHSDIRMWNATKFLKCTYESRIG
jgi:hypothetical protein